MMMFRSDYDDFSEEGSLTVDSDDEGSDGAQGGLPKKTLVVDFGLRQLTVYSAITGMTGTTLRCYERLDGSPLVPGVDWDNETSQTKVIWQHFLKSPLRNAKKAVEIRLKFVDELHSPHTDYLPLHYDPKNFIRPRKGYHNLLNPPLWTTEHYESQFLPATMKFSAEVLASMSEQFIMKRCGVVRFLDLRSKVDGKDVDYHIQVEQSPAGHAAFTVNGISIHLNRVPRGCKVGPNSHDVLELTVIQHDSSRIYKQLMEPPTLHGNRRIHLSVYHSTAVEVEYVKEKLDRVGEHADRLGNKFEARADSQTAFLRQLDAVPDSKTNICVEVKNVQLLTGILQDKELVRAEENAISAEPYFVAEFGSDDTNEGYRYQYSVAGTESIIALEGRVDPMQKPQEKETLQDVLSKKLDSLHLSEGKYEYV